MLTYAGLLPTETLRSRLPNRCAPCSIGVNVSQRPIYRCEYELGSSRPFLLDPAEAVFKVVSHGEDNDALGRLDADIGVQADHMAAGRLLNYLLQ